MARYESRNITQLTTISRSVELATSILQLRSAKLNRLRGSLWAKASAIFVPVVQMNLLRLDSIQHNKFGFMVLADFISMLLRLPF